MWTTLIATIKALFRTPSVLIWCVVFPLALPTLFMVMFSGLANDGTLDPVPVAVVQNQDWNDSEFSQVVKGFNEEGDDRLFQVTYVNDREAGSALIKNGSVAGMYEIDSKFMPVVTLPPDNVAGSLSMSSLRGTILQRVADSYLQNYQLIESSIKENPRMAANPGAISAALGISVEAKQFSATRSLPDETVRYYYVLLAMVALMAGTQNALISLCWLQPSVSVLGARRMVAGTSRTRQLLGVILGSWVVSMLCSYLSFGYLCLVVGIDFAGREGFCLLGLAVATLASTALGALVGSLPLKGGSDVRSGALLALVMGLCVIAGLVGTGSMELSDALAQAWPPEAWLNPARLIADLFYSLYYYDSLNPFGLRLLVCAAMAVVFFAVSAVFLRRQRHEHL